MFPEHPKNLYGSPGAPTVEYHSSGLSLGSHGAVCMVQCAVCNVHGAVCSVPHHFFCALRNSCSRIAVCIEVPRQRTVCKHLLQTLRLPLNLLAVFPRGKGFIFGKAQWRLSFFWIMHDFSRRDYGEGVFADLGVQTFTYGFEQKRYIFIFSFLSFKVSFGYCMQFQGSQFCAWLVLTPASFVQKTALRWRFLHWKYSVFFAWFPLGSVIFPCLSKLSSLTS